MLTICRFASDSTNLIQFFSGSPRASRRYAQPRAIQLPLQRDVHNAHPRHPHGQLRRYEAPCNIQSLKMRHKSWIAQSCFTSLRLRKPLGCGDHLAHTPTPHVSEQISTDPDVFFSSCRMLGAWHTSPPWRFSPSASPRASSISSLALAGRRCLRSWRPER